MKMKREADRLISTYFNPNNLEMVRKNFLNKEHLSIAYGNSDASFHRGFYSPALLLDIGIGNIYRGTIITDEKKQKSFNSTYYYNYNRQLCLIERFEKSNGSISLTLVCKEKDKDFSITVPLTEGEDCITIAETCFKENQIQNYVELVFSLTLKYDEEKDEESWWTLNSLIERSRQGKPLLDLVDEKIKFLIEEYYYDNNSRLIKGVQKFAEIIEGNHFDFDETHFEVRYQKDMLSDEVFVVDKERGLAGIFSKIVSQGEYYPLTDVQKNIIRSINEKKNMFEWV